VLFRSLLVLEGHEIKPIPASPLARVGQWERLSALARLGLGVPRAAALLRRHAVRLVIGTGGYGSASGLLAARSLGLPTAIVEPNVQPGLANRWLAGMTDRVYVAHAETLGRLRRGCPVLTGVPVRGRAAVPGSFHRRRPQDARIRLLVVSSARGEAFFDDRLPALCQALQQRGRRIALTHQTTAGPAPALAERYRRLGVDASVTPFIVDMAQALRDADFVISRAGASTIAEIALAGVPSLLVALGDAAEDHQALNASGAAGRGAATWIREADWAADTVAATVTDVLDDDARWRRMTAQLHALAAPDAARCIVADCEALMAGRWG
jgi:UDP-N-acetylglucosamine--N-acetylmuramyl-(pentapeptide) pyrophosphoryl-undecaprenol N-acetylglucosamine transferase